MKKILLLICLLIGTCSAFAQSTNEDPAKVEQRIREVQEYKMKYLAQEMDLSEAQKKKFFEVYEEMLQSKYECYQEAVKLDRKIKHEDGATEQDYHQVTEAFNNANTRWAEQEKIYNEKYAEFLSSKQIYKMKEAESTFKAKLDEMRHNRKKDRHKKKDHK